MKYSAFHTISVVTQRDIRQTLRTKGIMITLAILLLLSVAGPFVAGNFRDTEGSSSHTPDSTIALYGVDKAALRNSAHAIIESTSQDTAYASVARNDVEAAFILNKTTLQFVHDGEVSPDLQKIALTLQEQISLEKTLAKVGVTPDQLSHNTVYIDLEDKNLSKNNTSERSTKFGDIIFTLIGVFILVLSVTLFSANVGSRVTEEKSSRIIEIIVAAVKPLHFLAGKILGNAIFGTCATALIFIVGTLSLKASDLLENISVSIGIIPVLIVSYILGILFFSSMYAAAGAMVHRTEDLQSTQSPIMILVFAVMYTPMIFFNSMDSIIVQALAWIPPLSVGNAPLQYAAGNMNGLEFTFSMLIMLVFTIGTIWIVARIYTFAILYNGAKLTWSQAIKARA